jgi:NTE family protein
MMRIQAGWNFRKGQLAQAPWQGEFDPLEGVILHEAQAPMLQAAE